MAHRRPARERRPGFTILELLIVISMVGLLAMVSMGRTSRLVTSWRVTRAAQAFSEELQTGFALVGRNRKPLTMTLDMTKLELRFSDRAGVIYRRRSFGPGSEYKLSASNITASRTTLEIYPPGLAADSLSVMITQPGTSRRVRMLRGGLVQICSTGATNTC